MENNIINIKCIKFQPLNTKTPLSFRKWRDGHNEIIKYRAINIKDNPTKYCRNLHGEFRIVGEIEYMPSSEIRDVNLYEWAGATFISEYNLEDMTMTVARPYLISFARMGKIIVEGTNIKELVIELLPIRSVYDMKIYMQKTSLLHKFINIKEKEVLWSQLKDSIIDASVHLNRHFELKHNPREVYDTFSSFISEINNELEYFGLDYKNRNVNDNHEQKYKDLIAKKSVASTEEEFTSLALGFQNLGNYGDSKHFTKVCDSEFIRLVEEKKERKLYEEKERRYFELDSQIRNAKDESDYFHLYEEFIKLGKHEDAPERADECYRRLIEIKTEREKREKLQKYCNILLGRKKAAKTEAEYKLLAEEFDKLDNFSNSRKFANECRGKHQQLKAEREKHERFECIYQELLSKKSKAETEEDFIELSYEFSKLGVYKDCSNLANECSKHF